MRLIGVRVGVKTVIVKAGVKREEHGYKQVDKEHSTGSLFDQSKTYQGYKLEVVCNSVSFANTIYTRRQTNAKTVERWFADELHSFSRIESSGPPPTLVILNIFATRAGHMR